ncbi:MAG: Fe-S cluster assembly protein SufD [Micromonosporaceae bacterium]|nr:Fe-S cluster assembly protein SufD [Micromonosporaceae bacterium]
MVASHLHPVASYDLEAHPAPTGREEVWRFTPLKRLRGLLDGGPSDGHLSWKHDTPDGVTFGRLSTEQAIALGAPAPMDRLAALAVAHGQGAALIEIPAEAVLDEPLVVRLTGDSADDLVWGHIVVKVGPYSKATLVFEHTGSARYASSVSVLLGDGAQLDLVSLQLWDDDAVHTGQISWRVGRDAKARSFQASLGGDLVRLVETAEYAGPGGEVEMRGLYFVEAGQHIEHRLFVDHNAPQTRSKVDYRGALQGEGARSVWIGNVLIRKVAEAIDTYESNRNLVLTDGAQAHSVPNLEIETGEIEGAGHASATGRFDDEQLFYLMSRGVPEPEARKLVVRGFFAELLNKLPAPEYADRLIAEIDEGLAKAGA